MTKLLPLFDTPPESLAEIKERVLLLLNMGWCKHEYAKDIFGRAVGFTNKYARKVCMLGAIKRGCHTATLDLFMSFITKLELNLINHSRLNDFNDDPETTKDDVIGLVKSIDVEEVNQLDFISERDCTKKLTFAEV